MIPGIAITKYNAQLAGIVKSAPVSRDFQTLYGRASVLISSPLFPRPVRKPVSCPAFPPQVQAHLVYRKSMESLNWAGQNFGNTASLNAFVT